MTGISKQCVLLIVLSVAAMFLQAQLSHVLHFLLYLHNVVASWMAMLFSAGKYGMIIQGILALVIVPLVAGFIMAAAFWLVKHVSMPHMMLVVWLVWLVMLVTILAKAA